MHQNKLQVGVNLLGNKYYSDSDSDSDSDTHVYDHTQTVVKFALYGG